MQNLTPSLSFIADADIGDRRLALLSSGKVVAAGASDEPRFTTQQGGAKADQICAVYDLKGGGTREVVASESISANAEVYAAANGKVASTGTNLVGEALEAANGDNDIIEILPAS